VAPSLRILGGQAVQADRLLRAWRDDPEVDAWLVPLNPVPPGTLAALTRVKYVRTVATQLVYWPLLVRELRHADVVHVFSASYVSFLLAPLPAVIVARLLGRPVIVNYRSGEAPDHLERSAVARATLARTDRNVVPSSFLRDVFARFGLAADVISNVVDLDAFRHRPRSPLRPRLVSTRNFEPLYNVACTLRAFAAVQARHPDASLTLVGGGSEEPRLRDLAVSLGLRNVRFAGRVPPGEIWRYYDDADIYVQTPDIDNMPSSVLEAYASGLPVVSTGAGGVPAILTHEVHGLLAPVGDEAAVAGEVLRLLADQPLADRVTANALASCAGRTWPAVRDRWLGLYRELARGRSPSFRIRKKMTAPELASRALTAARTLADAARWRAARPRWRRERLLDLLAPDPVLDPVRKAAERRDWVGTHRALARHFATRPRRFPLVPSDRARIDSIVRSAYPKAPAHARRRATSMLEGRYDILGYRDVPFGAPPDWHLDPLRGRRAPRLFWASVPYLDPAVGDHKVIWEINRHQHWLALGRAAWLADDRTPRREVIAQLESWLAENPPLTGINWASMLELGFRSISWLWTVSFFAEGAEEDETPWLVDLLVALDAQLEHVRRNPSRYFSPNTHLTGEALALYVAGLALPELRHAARWARVGRAVLLDEIGRQILPDGGHVERSTQYHRYTLDFYLFALLMARLTGDHRAECSFAPACARLAAFARAVADDGGRLPPIGDDDGGLLFPICGRDPADVRDSLETAARLLDEPSFAAWPETEEAVWLLRGWMPGDRRENAPAARRPAAARFDSTGYYVARTSRWHLVFDVGAHGFLNGGHAHADALAITLGLGGGPFLIDPGTALYTIDAALRDRFRDTRAHNTLVVDGRPHSAPAGPFQWTSRTDAHPAIWSCENGVIGFEGWHHGYAPALHRRTVVVLDDLVVIADHLVGDRARHAVRAHWHVHPEWRPAAADDGAWRFVNEAREHTWRHVWLWSSAGSGCLHQGDAETGLGWISPRYGRVDPASTLAVDVRGAAPQTLITVVGASPRPARVRMIHAPGPPEDGWLRTGVRVERADETLIVLFATEDGASQASPGEAIPHPPAVWHVGDVATDARMAVARLSAGGEGTVLAAIGGSARLTPGLTMVVEQPLHAG
jgi:glycosyltransferase involved in cell wall biosynthesis